MLGRVLQDFFTTANNTSSTPSSSSSPRYGLQDYLQLYQAIRFPRAEKVQLTSRQAGDLYEMRSEDVVGLSYEDGLSITKAKLQDRMKWIWTDDIDSAYEKARKNLKMGGQASSSL